MNNLPARTGWDWLKQGMALFRKQPAALTTLLFASILLAIGISAVPFIGPIIVVVLIPVVLDGLHAGLPDDRERRPRHAGVLLTGFRKPALGGLCKVGVIYLGVFLVLTLVALLVTPESLRQLPGQHQDRPEGQAAVHAGRRAGRVRPADPGNGLAADPVLCRPAHLLEADGAGQGHLLQLLRRDPLGARVRRAAAVLVRHLLPPSPSWW
jgi:hypothetical protein